MSFHRLWAIMHKEFRHVQRDRRMLVLVTISPSLMLLTFAYLFSVDASTSYLAVYDADRSSESRALIQMLATDTELVLTTEAKSLADLRTQIQDGTVKLGLAIPPGAGADLSAGKRAEVQVISDGADPINSAAQMARLSTRLTTWGAAYRLETVPRPIEVRTLVWFNSDLKSSNSMVPALLAIVLILPAMAVALALTREKELGSFEGLAATPVRPTEYILGKLIPYIVYGLVGAAVAVLVALVWFRVPFRGSFFNLVTFTGVYLWATLGISTMLAGFMSTQSTALRAILLLFVVPSFFLTGIVVPVDSESRLMSSLLPSTHFVTIGRGLFLKGLGWLALGPELFILITMGAVSIAVAVITFRKRVG